MFNRSENCIAQGALTNSKNPSSHVKGIYPTHVKAGQGCHLWDMNDVKYVDYICGLGTNLLGYGNNLITQELLKHIYSGFSHSLPSYHEVECAETIQQFMPFIERVKFLKTGSEACSAAVTIARSFTGRDVVLSDGYHGWHSEFTSLTPPANGCIDTDCISKLPLSTDDWRFDNKLAAVIIEPIIVENSPDRIEYLKFLRAECTKVGALLIFDETITGMRYRNWCVANDTNITPDLIILGKALANGLPLACVGGKAEVMDGDYFVSSTYAGETMSLVACQKVFNIMHSKLDYSISELWRKGATFIEYFNCLCPELVRLKAYPVRGVFEGEPLHLALFFQECCRAHILFGKSWFYNFDLIQYDDETLLVCNEIFKRMKSGKVRLAGDLPRSPFSLKSRRL